MNNRTAIGLVAAIIIVGLLIFLFGRHVPQTVQLPLGTTAPSTETATSAPPVATPAAKPAAPSVAATKPASAPTSGIKVSAPKITAFDESSLTSSASRPLITGTANIKAVALVINDPSGTGIAGADYIPVENGHWSYAAPQALTPGVYTLDLIGGDSIVVAHLRVTAQ